MNASLPPYAFVPGGPWPHPRNGPGGHSAGRREEPVGPVVCDDWRDSDAYLGGIRLFNAGYYWESHEAWESLWHAHGRRGPVADLLKALIKLAAAGVKVREGQPRGVATHAGRAAELFRGLRASVGPRLLGLDLEEWSRIADELARQPDRPAGPREAAVWCVFEFQIVPS